MTARVHQPWDTHAKLWLFAQIKALVDYLMPGAVFDLSPALDALDKELLIKKLIADYFFLVRWNGELIILHIEFQRYKDEDMARRMWQYNTNKDLFTGLRVYSILIYLVPQENVVVSPYIRKIGEFGHTFTFVVIKLWELEKEIFLHPNRSGLLPLLTLAKDGKNRETVQEMVQTIQERGCDDLLELAYDFAALTFPGKRAKEWLKEEFPMLNTLPILEQSWRVQELLERGREEGREEAREEMDQLREEAARAVGEAARIQLQTLQQSAIKVVARRFPRLEALARVLIAQVSDVARLETLIGELSTVSDQRRAREVLDSLVLDTSNDGIQSSEEVSSEEKVGTWKKIFCKVLFWRHRP